MALPWPSLGHPLALTLRSLCAFPQSARAQADIKAKAKRITELEKMVARLEQDGEKLRQRLESKETVARESKEQQALLQGEVEAMQAEAKRTARGLGQAREELLEKKQLEAELQRNVSFLSDENERLKRQLEKKLKENATFAERVTHAEAVQQMLEQRLQAGGKSVGDGSSSLELRPLENVKQAAGVYDPLKQMPNVPVLEEMASTVEQANSTLKADKELITKMNEVKVFEVDASLPPDPDDPPPEPPKPPEPPEPPEHVEVAIPQPEPATAAESAPAAPAAVAAEPTPAAPAGAAALTAEPVPVVAAEGSGAGQLVIAGANARPVTPGKPSQESEPTPLA